MIKNILLVLYLFSIYNLIYSTNVPTLPTLSNLTNVPTLPTLPTLSNSTNVPNTINSTDIPNIKNTTHTSILPNLIKNAAYLPYGWSIYNQDESYLLNNIILMKRLNIHYAFCNIGTITDNGTLTLPPNNFIQYIRLVKQILPQQKILAWINGDSSIIFTSLNFYQNMNDTIINLFNRYDIDGIHLDIEPINNNDQNFVNLLSIIKSLFNNIILSIATPYSSWSISYIQQLEQFVDIFCPMIYDTESTNIIDYINYVYKGAKVWLRNCNKSIIATLPAYAINEYHNPSIENIATCIDGLFKAMYETNNIFSGYALWNWYEMTDIDIELWLEKCTYMNSHLVAPFIITGSLQLNTDYSCIYNLPTLSNSTITTFISNTSQWIIVYVNNVLGLTNVMFRIYPNDRTIQLNYPNEKSFSMLNQNGYINEDYFSFKLLTTNRKINTFVSIEITYGNIKSYIEGIKFTVS